MRRNNKRFHKGNHGQNIKNKHHTVCSLVDNGNQSDIEENR